MMTRASSPETLSPTTRASSSTLHHRRTEHLPRRRIKSLSPTTNRESIPDDEPRVYSRLPHSDDDHMNYHPGNHMMNYVWLDLS
ncbi:hypothetical protein F2Q69_00031072 [Brassica cretica]|uniref:Uncharacterized protein n=1 Tax=Brassica cretica TaxID=69181 RepID=A0A8S9S742_BRACR|nr:hypothetical protein F2Q69_00031072 [Brassica cretica]